MSILGAILKTAVDTAVLPFSVAKDCVTLGGVLNADGFGNGESATVARLRKIAQDAESIGDEAGKL